VAGDLDAIWSDITLPGSLLRLPRRQDFLHKAQDLLHHRRRSAGKVMRK
jgi:hypothetical protein